MKSEVKIFNSYNPFLGTAFLNQEKDRGITKFEKACAALTCPDGDTAVKIKTALEIYDNNKKDFTMEQAVSLLKDISQLAVENRICLDPQCASLIEELGKSVIPSKFTKQTKLHAIIDVIESLSRMKMYVEDVYKLAAREITKQTSLGVENIARALNALSNTSKRSTKLNHQLAVKFLSNIEKSNLQTFAITLDSLQKLNFTLPDFWEKAADHFASLISNQQSAKPEKQIFLAKIARAFSGCDRDLAAAAWHTSADAYKRLFVDQLANKELDKQALAILIDTAEKLAIEPRDYMKVL